MSPNASLLLSTLPTMELIHRPSVPLLSREGFPVGQAARKGGAASTDDDWAVLGHVRSSWRIKSNIQAIPIHIHIHTHIHIQHSIKELQGCSLGVNPTRGSRGKVEE